MPWCVCSHAGYGISSLTQKSRVVSSTSEPRSDVALHAVTAIQEVAAAEGQLEVLKWMHGIGCTLDPVVTDQAIGNNRVELLQWAYDQGCSIQTHSSYFAARLGECPPLCLHEVALMLNAEPCGGEKSDQWCLL